MRLIKRILATFIILQAKDAHVNVGEEHIEGEEKERDIQCLQAKDADVKVGEHKMNNMEGWSMSSSSSQKEKKGDDTMTQGELASGKEVDDGKPENVTSIF